MMPTEQKPRILFMGTPEFAVPSLELLVEKAWPVIGVVTQPDRPKGRGQRLVASPVKEAAERRGLAVYQPEKVRAPEFLEVFRGLAPDMVVLVAFGQILPKNIIDGPPLGCVNVHPSLLPKYGGKGMVGVRVQEAVMRAGEREAGCTVHYVSPEIDAGEIILQKSIEVDYSETPWQLGGRVFIEENKLLVEAVRQIKAENGRNDGV